MRRVVMLFFCCFCISNVFAQQYVHVIKCDSITGESQSIPALSGDKYLHMAMPLPGEELKLPSQEEVKKLRAGKYYINISDLKDTLQVVKELLELEGDTRVLCVPIRHSRISSSLYSGVGKDLSVQVYALYIIWGLFFDYQYHAPFPVLSGRVDGEREKVTTSGPLVEAAFTAYKKWFEENQDNLRKEHPFVNNTKVGWLM